MRQGYVVGGAHDGFDRLWIRPKVCQRSGVVRDVLGTLYAVRLKCTGFCVVGDLWQTGGDGVGGVGGEDLVDVGHLVGLDKDRCVDFLFEIKLFLGCAAITLCAFLFLYR